MRLSAALLALLPQICAAEITSASYDDPTDAYGHGALAGGEYATLDVGLADGRRWSISYENAVFEDVAPRLVDLNSDGSPEIVTVASTFDQGARVQVFDWVHETIAPVAMNAPIGKRHRWLAIAGIADFDGNGRLEVAYVDRPHLAKVLTFLEIHQEGESWIVTPKAKLEGHTNHRIGEAAISGGVRECDGIPEAITLSADRSRVQITRNYESRDAGPYDGPKSVMTLLNCRN